MNVNLSTSENTFVCFADDGAPVLGEALLTTGVCCELDEGVAAAEEEDVEAEVLPRLLPEAAFVKALKKPSLDVVVVGLVLVLVLALAVDEPVAIDDDDDDEAAPTTTLSLSLIFSLSLALAPDGTPTPNRAPGRFTLAGWNVTRGL